MAGTAEATSRILKATSSGAVDMIGPERSEGQAWWEHGQMGLIIRLDALTRSWPVNGQALADLGLSSATHVLGTVNVREGNLDERVWIGPLDQGSALASLLLKEEAGTGEGLDLVDDRYAVCLSGWLGPLEEFFPALIDHLSGIGKEKEAAGLEQTIAFIAQRLDEAGQPDLLSTAGGEVFLALDLSTLTDRSTSREAPQQPGFLVGVEIRNRETSQQALEGLLAALGEMDPAFIQESVDVEGIRVWKMGRKGDKALFAGFVGQHVLFSGQGHRIAEADKASSVASGAWRSSEACENANLMARLQPNILFDLALNRPQSGPLPRPATFFLLHGMEATKGLPPCCLCAKRNGDAVELCSESAWPGPCSLAALFSVAQLMKDRPTRLSEKTRERMKETEKAIRKHRAATGTWPKDLASLVPQYLTQAPEDPFHQGGILRYDPGPVKELATGQRIYTKTWMLLGVGPDGDEDVALGEKTPEAWSASMEDPASAAQMKDKIYQFRKNLYADEKPSDDEGDILWLGKP